MANVYINPEAGTNGDGSEGSPYNSFTEVNTWSTDRAGDWIYIKRGTTARAQLTMTGGATNYNIGAYGTGTKPVIKGSDIEASWTQEDSFWYASSYSTEGQTFKDGYPLTRQATKASLVSGEYHHDSGNNRIYIADDPSLYTIEISVRNACINARDPLIIRDIECRHCINSAFTIEQLNDDVQIISCDGYYGGSNGGTGKNNFQIKGTDNLNLVTNLRVRYCTSTGALNNDFEVHYADGAIFEENISYGCLGNMFEFWQYVQNSTVQRNKAYADDTLPNSRGRITRFIWFAGPANTSALGINTGNTVKNNLAVGGSNSINWAQISDTNNDNLLYHNTCINFGEDTGATDTGAFLRINADAPVPTGTIVKGNIISTTKNDPFINVNTAATVTFDDNIWYNTTTTEWLYKGSTTTDLATWNALDASVGTDFNEDPVLASDYSPDNGSPAINAGATGLDVSDDINGDARQGNPDIGAFEKKILVSSTIMGLPL